jgi:hypothetical protein
MKPTPLCYPVVHWHRRCLDTPGHHCDHWAGGDSFTWAPGEVTCPTCIGGLRARGPVIAWHVPRGTCPHEADVEGYPCALAAWHTGDHVPERGPFILRPASSTAPMLPDTTGRPLRLGDPGLRLTPMRGGW